MYASSAGLTSSNPNALINSGNNLDEPFITHSPPSFSVLGSWSRTKASAGPCSIVNGVEVVIGTRDSVVSGCASAQ